MRVPRGVSPAVLLALVVVACGGSTPPTDAPVAPESARPPASASAAAPSQPRATIPPLETAAPPGPSSAAPSDSPSPPGSVGPGAADACTGTDANRDFFESVATAVAWPVYCAVLPSGWFVDAGEYRLASGGRMEISYRGPAGASFELRQGAFCTTDGGCLPAGTDLGEASFGDLAGSFVSADDGSWALGVDAGADISWLAVGDGLDEATFRGFAEELALVSD
jgi:hypothetical protein